MTKILILANHFITLYAFRREFIDELLSNGYEVYLALPPSEENIYFSDKGCKVVETPIDRRGTNPLSDIKLFFQYTKVMKAVNPDLVLTYTIKPNTYGGLASRLCKIKVLHTVTGLGSIYIRNMWQRKIAINLNRLAFKNAETVIFLNEDNKNFYENLKIIEQNQNTLIVPGSGVNLNHFKYIQQDIENPITFTFVGRILKDKGIDEYLKAAKELVSKYNNVIFEVIGFVDEDKYINLLKQYEKNGIINYLGKRNDIPELMAKSSCIVLPSYGEGRGTVLQEGAAIGRPLITTDTYGCRENVEDGYNGYLCDVADAESLTNAMERFINLSKAEKDLMGKRSREKAEREFDREIVMSAYLDKVENIIKEKG